jgi:CheY-like chemotaxis protein/anti-sigma regulatory factor (Ser/Thr protein kinase)
VRIGSKPIEFYLEVDEKLPSKVIGDILRLKQVLSNLLSNAIKYTSKGYAKLSVTFEEDGEDIILYLKVEDTGQGLKPEDLERMFSAYIRFNATANRTTEGTGLGLSITKRLVEMMDGTISVESEYGKGSIFTVALRQKTVDCPPIGAELANKLQNSLFFLSENHLAGLRIDRDPMPYGKVLVVDDVETNLLVAEGLMNPYKLEIETANSGFEAIDIISAGNVYDIIFMDHMMPDMDGIEATARLRELGYTEPIVALTANAVAGQADVFMQNGFDAFVSKPIDIRQLDAALNRFIRDKQTPEVIEAARKQYADAKADSDSKKKSDTLLIDSFIRDARKTLSVLDEVMQRDKYGKDDIQRYIVVVHGIKSSLLNIGEKELSEQAYSLEQAGRNGDKSVIKENSPGFVEKVNNLLEALEEKREQEKQSAPEETGDIHGKLLELADLCADYNRKGAMELLEGIGKCSAETQAVIDELKENVLHSQFEDAESAARGFCEKIADKQENTKEDQ